MSTGESEWQELVEEPEPLDQLEEDVAEHLEEEYPDRLQEIVEESPAFPDDERVEPPDDDA